MKSLWFLLLPLLALPDMWMAQQTAVGTLKFTDFVIMPYLLLAWWAGPKTRGWSSTKPLAVLLWAFYIWAGVSTATIGLRYSVLVDASTQAGLAKLAKFALYATAGLATARVCAASPVNAKRLRWAVLGALLVTALSLYAAGAAEAPAAPDQAGFAYEATNTVSAGMAMLLAFVIGEWASQTKQAVWRNVGVLVLPVVLFGFLLTGGRGGWVGLFVALGYILLRAGLKPGFVVGGLLMLSSVAIAYTQNESFAHHVDITVNPELLDEETEFAQATGFDDGNRVTIFLKESVKLVNDPIFGAGMFHRGFGGVGLDPNGSHNFFLQMFLETGLVGGGITLALFYRLWMTSGPQPGRPKEQLGVRAAIVAGVVSACTGEYFYGGVALFYLFALVGPALEGLAPDGTLTDAGNEHALGATADA